jgi:hypothetical protein
MTDRHVQPPLAALDEYRDVAYLLREVRIMQAFFTEVVSRDPKLNKHYDALYIPYREILQREFAPHAYTLALAIVELENAYPEILRSAVEK